MAVLVDEARWEWRGARWAHLVSDVSYDELHGFAQRLGKRRLGFQGDHYDIDHVDQRRALELGAEFVDARELVRRLRGAGLRRRDHKPTWQRVAEAPPGSRLAVGALGNGFGSAGRRMIESLERLDRVELDAASSLYADSAHLVTLLDFGVGDDPAVPVLPEVDELWVGGPRADGARSVELFVSR